MISISEEKKEVKRTFSTYQHELVINLFQYGSGEASITMGGENAGCNTSKYKVPQAVRCFKEAGKNHAGDFDVVVGPNIILAKVSRFAEGVREEVVLDIQTSNYKRAVEILESYKEPQAKK